MNNMGGNKGKVYRKETMIMDNNVYQNQQQNQNSDYLEKANRFLKSAIISSAISFLPVGSIIAISMASKNRKALLEYLDRGGLHTIRIKFASAFSRAGKYSGVGFTILWAGYLLYFLALILALIFGITFGVASSIQK